MEKDSFIDYEKYTVNELKKIANQRGIQTNGLRKVDIIKRLQDTESDRGIHQLLSPLRSRNSNTRADYSMVTEMPKKTVAFNNSNLYSGILKTNRPESDFEIPRKNNLGCPISNIPSERITPMNQVISYPSDNSKNNLMKMKNENLDEDEYDIVTLMKRINSLELEVNDLKNMVSSLRSDY